jgi:hypothetical protein
LLLVLWHWCYHWLYVDFWSHMWEFIVANIFGLATLLTKMRLDLCKQTRELKNHVEFLTEQQTRRIEQHLRKGRWRDLLSDH